MHHRRWPSTFGRINNMLRLLRVTFGVVLLSLVASFSGCGPKAPEKDQATLDQEAKELDKKVKDGESGL
jgi:hypothetical protein